MKSLKLLSSCLVLLTASSNVYAFSIERRIEVFMPEARAVIAKTQTSDEAGVQLQFCSLPESVPFDRQAATIHINSSAANCLPMGKKLSGDPEQLGNFLTQASELYFDRISVDL